MTDSIDNGAIKIIEIMGISSEGFDDALNQAIAKAADSIKGIVSLEVIRQTATVKDGRISRYEVTAKLSFVVK